MSESDGSEKFFTVPWIPGMEVDQMPLELWQAITEHRQRAERLIERKGISMALFRWTVVQRIMQSDAGAALPAMMLGMGLLEEYHP